MKLWRAWVTLFWVGLRRLVWSTNTLMVLFPLIGCVLFVLRRHYERIQNQPRAFDRFSEFLLFVFAAFLIPICAVAYGTASIGSDREDRTLIFLLVRPVPRPIILLSRFLAALPVCLGLVLGEFALICWLAGPVGVEAFHRYLPAMTLMTLAYLGLFHLFSVLFRHATIVALIYSLFMELMLGNLPGIIKRVAVNYYGRSMIYAGGQSAGLKAPDPQWFEPMAAPTAAWILVAFAAGGLAAAMAVFQWREYRDLT